MGSGQNSRRYGTSRIRSSIRQNDTLTLVLSNTKVRYGGSLFFFVVSIAILAPVISPMSPYQEDTRSGLLPPGATVGDRTHLLGTDNFGRDVLNRLMYGARMSLFIGFSVMSIALVVGTSLGLTSGYYRGWVDDVIMRIVDIKQAFPMTILAIAIVAVLGASATNLIMALAITLWTSPARLVRAETLRIVQLDYVAALKAIGVKDAYIIFKEILPNLVGPLFIVATMEVAATILMEAGLSFLGLGVPPPTPTWGELLNQGRTFIFDAYWLAILPGILIFVTVLGINLLGDGLRDTLDPRLRT